MNKITQLFATAMFAAVVSFGFAASAQDEHAGYATVVRVEGIASYNLGDGNWHPLIAGKKLLAGSTIRTGENGVVDVILGKKIDFPQSSGAPDRISQSADYAVRGLISDKPASQQNAIRLTPGTVLAINKLNITDTGADTVSDTELDLQKGKIFGSVKKLSAASQYLVKIPNGIAGIRGTKFELGADDSAACFDSESGGLTLVLYINGQTVQFQIVPGQMVDPGLITSGPNAGSTVPITPGIQAILANVFAALTTTYHIDVDYNSPPNGNCLYISSVTGAKGKKVIVIPQQNPAP